MYYSISGRARVPGVPRVHEGINLSSPWQQPSCLLACLYVCVWERERERACCAIVFVYTSSKSRMRRRPPPGSAPRTPHHLQRRHSRQPRRRRRRRQSPTTLSRALSSYRSLRGEREKKQSERERERRIAAAHAMSLYVFRDHRRVVGNPATDNVRNRTPAKPLYILA